MTMKRSVIGEILKIAKRNKGVIYWEDDYTKAPMEFRYRFVFQKTQFKCFYEFVFDGKWCEQKVYVIDIPYGRKHKRYVGSSFKDTVFITQLYAHLKELCPELKKGK